MNEYETEMIADLMGMLYRVVMDLTHRGKRVTREAIVEAMLEQHVDQEMISKTVNELVDIGRILDQEA